MAEITIASLFEQAADRLRADFEYVRQSNPHAAEKGQEAEAIIRGFLNQHMPKRWRADSGIVIDFNNDLSKQSDVLIYDSLSSPLYRAAERMNILPAHNVAAVVEVKSTLNKKELYDAYEKIASVKKLKRLPITNVDRFATGSNATTTAPLGVVFAFKSDTSLDSLADNIVEFNKSFPSRTWPDVVVVLDRGVITYAIQWPGQETMAGLLLTAAPAPEQSYGPPPWFVHLCVHHDGSKALNRFFSMLLTQLTFYPWRSGAPSFGAMLGSDESQALTITGYQYDLGMELKPVSEDLLNENNPTVDLHIEIRGPDGEELAVIQYIPWQDGAAVRKYGPLPLAPLLQMVTSRSDLLALSESAVQGKELSTVFPLSEEEFRNWPAIIESRSNFQATFIDKNAA